MDTMISKRILKNSKHTDSEITNNFQIDNLGVCQTDPLPNGVF